MLNEAELWDINVSRRLIGTHLKLEDEERKKDVHMDRIFSGKIRKKILIF